MHCKRKSIRSILMNDTAGKPHNPGAATTTTGAANDVTADSNKNDNDNDYYCCCSSCISCYFPYSCSYLCCSVALQLLRCNS